MTGPGRGGHGPVRHTGCHHETACAEREHTRRGLAWRRFVGEAWPIRPPAANSPPRPAEINSSNRAIAEAEAAELLIADWGRESSGCIMPLRGTAPAVLGLVRVSWAGRKRPAGSNLASKASKKVSSWALPYNQTRCGCSRQLGEGQEREERRRSGACGM